MHRSGQHWKGLVLGAVGGAVGTLAMSAFVRRASRRTGNPQESKLPAAPVEAASFSVAGKQFEDGEASTEALGRLAYQAVTGEAPRTEETRHALSQQVHWAFGTAMGALYGAGRGRGSAGDLLGGALFGAGVWVFSELGLPLLGLSPGPTAIRPAKHAEHLAAHLVYGTVLSVTTQALHRLTADGRPSPSRAS